MMKKNKLKDILENELFSIEIEEDNEPSEYDKRRKKEAELYAGFFEEDLRELGVSESEAKISAESFKNSFLNPQDDEDDE